MTTYTDQRLKEAIRTRRAALDLLQSQAAERAGISTARWTAIETGRALVKVSTLVALARALECSPVELLPELGFEPEKWEKADA